MDASGASAAELEHGQQRDPEQGESSDGAERTHSAMLAGPPREVTVPAPDWALGCSVAPLPIAETFVSVPPETARDSGRALTFARRATRPHPREIAQGTPGGACLSGHEGPHDPIGRIDTRGRAGTIRMDCAIRA